MKQSKDFLLFISGRYNYVHLGARFDVVAMFSLCLSSTQPLVPSHLPPERQVPSYSKRQFHERTSCSYAPLRHPLSNVRRRFHLESLEQRTMLAADLRSIDGSNNNLLHPEWGSTAEQLLRLAPAEYANGASTPAGADRASSRTISSLVVSQADQGLNDRGMSAFIYVWGQFLDHDLSLTTTRTPAESMPVSVPINDPYFDPFGTGTVTMGLNRSIYDSTTGTAP